MSEIRSYRDLQVWKLGMAVAAECYRLTQSFPRNEMFGLTSQIRRAACSVPANIAEGRGRTGTRDFLKFLGIAHGSLSELATHLQLASDVGIVNREVLNSVLARTGEIGKMLTGLRQSLRLRLNKP
jgi:four helix bundle protein